MPFNCLATYRPPRVSEITRLVVLVVAILIVCPAGVVQAFAQNRKKPPEKQSAGVKPATLPITLTEILGVIDLFKRSLMTEASIIETIEKRGAAFPSSQSTLETIRENGASSAIIDAIVRVAPKPAIPPPPTTGTLTVRCLPAECEISINGKAAGVTNIGELTIPGLQLKDIVVDFSKKGYLSQQREVTVSPVSGAPVSVVLEPERSTKAENGKQLFLKVLSEIGVDSTLARLQSLAATGSFTSYTNGKPSEWDMELHLRGGQFEVSVNNSALGAYELTCSGERCVQPKKKRRLPFAGAKTVANTIAADLDLNLRAFYRNHFGAILQLLLSPSFELLAADLQTTPGNEQHIRAEARDGVYDVTIGPDLLPSIVFYKPISGLAGLTVTYGSYRLVGKIRYPTKTSVKLSGSAGQGFEVRLGDISFPEATVQ